MVDAPASRTDDAATLLDLLGDLAQGGDRPAVRAFTADGEDRLSYRELDDSARRLAGGLKARGLVPGDFVALFAPNSARWVQTRLGVLLAGGVAVSLDSDLGREPLKLQLADSDPKAIVTVRAHLDDLDAAGVLDGRDVWLLDAGPDDDARSWRNLAAAPIDALPRVAPDQTASLFYTSGTTGPPKGVPLTHRNIVGNLNAILALDLVGPGDRVLLPLPLHHSYPFIVGLLMPLITGATQVQPSGVSGPEIRHALSAGAVDIVVGVPRLYDTLAQGLTDRLRMGGAVERAMYRLLRLSGWLRRRFGVLWGRTLLRPLHKRLAPNLRLMASGGAKLEAETAQTLEAFGWMVLSGYGLVETASITTFNPPGAAKLGTAGKPAPGVQLRIDHDSAPDAPEGQGEIQISGPNVFPGYRNNADANAKAFASDGWFKSGDLGYLDADGYLVIVGRVKDMIVLPDGKNVAPDEVEAVYGESPYIRQIAVLERHGRLVGLVVPDMDALRGAGHGVSDVIRVSLGELGPRLPAYKRLSDWALVREPLPRTQLGKYQRHKLPALLDRAERGQGPADAPWSDDDRALLETGRGRQVWDWLQGKFPDHTLHPDTSPQLDLGIDSLAWVTLGLEIQERFAIALSEEQIARTLTLRDLLHEVNQAPAADAAGSQDAHTHRLVAEARHWLRPRGPVAMTTGRALHQVARGLTRLILGLKVEGLEHLPANGPLVITPNHVSDLDPVVLGGALDGRRAREVVWGAIRERLFTNLPGRVLARVAHMVPVDDRAPGASLAVGAEVLRQGHILVWFPEEWRAPDGRLQRFLPGIGRLLLDTDARALPCYIDGTYEAMPRGARWPKARTVTVRFGPPVSAGDLAGPDATPEAVAEALRARVAALSQRAQP
ncbi:AMP-binding protein [Rhodovibrio sodomensis]|nr:AMP-binding protein [Rhodovibrio sodomensis]